MQSFLQYRRFGKHVAAQYKRDKSKAEAFGHHDNSELTSPSSSNPDTLNPALGEAPVDAQDHAESRDPEKGELSGSPKENLDNGVLDPEKQEERTGRFEPIRATPSGRPEIEEDGAPISRASTARTTKSLGTALGTTLTGINVRDRSTKEGGEGKVFVVGYEGEKDIMNPHNWSKWTRFGAT